MSDEGTNNIIVNNDHYSCNVIPENNFNVFSKQRNEIFREIVIEFGTTKPIEEISNHKLVFVPFSILHETVRF